MFQYFPIFGLAIKKAKVNQKSSFVNLEINCVSSDTYHVLRSSVHWFWRRRIFKRFSIFGHCSPTDHVTWMIGKQEDH